MMLYCQKDNGDLDSKYAKDMLPAGTKAPEFTLNDINGKAVNISDFKGRKVVLQFWASWCPDCREEVPEVKALQASADPSKVAFVSVSFDKTFDAFSTYVKENYLGGVQLYDPAGKQDSTIGAAYHIKWIPSFYLIDENGDILFGTVMVEKIAEAINASTKNKITKSGLCSDESCAQ